MIPLFGYFIRLAIALALVMTPAAPPVAGESLVRAVAREGYRATGTTPQNAPLPRVPGLPAIATPIGSRILLPPARIVEGQPAGQIKSSTSGWLMLPVRIVESQPNRIVKSSGIESGGLPLARAAQAQEITQIRICSTDNGCTALITNTFAADARPVLYAAGYRNPVQFEGNQPVTWTVPASLTSTPSVGISTTLDGSIPGQYVITATLIATPTIIATATLTVTLGSLSSVVIRDAPGGGGSIVTDATRTAGTAWPLYAASYDADGDFRADQVVTWTLNGGIGSIAPLVAPSTVFTAGAVGSGSITAAASQTITDSTGTITVVYGAPNHVRLGLPVSGTAGVGFSAVITAEDVANNTVVTFTDSITLSTTNGGSISPQIVTPTAGVWTGIITMTAAGAARNVSAAAGAISGQSTINLNAGPPALLAIAPANAIRAAGTLITYTAVATDTLGNFIGDVTASTSFSISPGSGGSFVGNAVTPTVAGTWVVTGVNGAASTTTSVTITLGAPITLTIAPDAAVISAGARITYTAVATDAFGNFGDVTSSTSFTIPTGSGGVFAANAVTPTVAGTWTVTGTRGSAVDTAALSVSPAAPLTLTLSPATAAISAGVRITYTALASDVYGNIVGNVTGSTAFTIPAASGGVFAANVVTPTVAGSWTVTGTNGGLSDTASLSVSPAAPSTLRLSPAAAVISAGVRITYTAVATDVFGNFIGNVTAGTTFSIPTASGGVFAANAVTPTAAGSWTVTGTNGVAVDTSSLSVSAAAPFTLTLSPGTATISAGVRITYTAVATDAFGNFIGNVTAGTTFSIPTASGGVFAANVVTPTVAGTWTVTGTRGSAVDTAALSVSPAAPFTLTLSPATAAISAGVRITYTALASDVYGNIVGDVTGSTVFTAPAASGGVFAANVVTPTVAGSWTVTGTRGSAVDTAALSVSPAAPFTLTLSPGTATISAGVRITYTAVATDAFGNFIGNVTAGTVFSIPTASGGVFAANAVTPTVAGTWTVTGTRGSAVGTSTLSVTPAVPFTLTLSPATAAISAGVRITYTAVATDAFGNALGNVTAGTVFTIPAASGGVFAANVVTPTVAGSWTVTGTRGSAVDTAALSVSPAAPFTLTLSPATAAISAGVRITYTAVATDVFGNFVGNVTAATTFTIGPPAGGGFAGNVITPTIRNTYTVTGTHNTTGVRDTAVLTVTPNVPGTLELSPATAVISAGVRITYTTVATDAYGNFIGNVTAATTFTISPPAGGSFAGNIITPTIRNTYTVTGTHNTTGVRDTAVLTVTPNVPGTLELSPATATISAGVRITYTAVASDAFGNLIGNVTAATTFTISPPAGGSFAGNVITPTIRNTYTVTGTHNTTGVRDTAVLTVTPNAPFLLTLSPATAAISAGVRITFTAVATDTYGNFIGNVTPGTTFSIPTASGGVFAANAVTPTVAGTWPVTGTNGSAVDTSSLSVTPAAPFTLTLSPATATISAGARITYTAVATDVFRNFIGNVTAGTTFFIPPASGGVFAANVVTPTVAGVWPISGTNGVALHTVPLTVTPAAYQRLSIEDAPAGIGSPVNAVTITLYDTLALHAVAYDVYSNAIGSRVVTWTASGVLSGTLSPTSGISTTLTPAPIVSGTGIVSATSSGPALTDTAGPITILAPRLLITKVDIPDPVPAGGTLGYTIIYTNVGAATAQGIVITETYDPNVTFIGAVPAPDNPPTNTVWSSLAPLAPGQSALPISIFTTVGGSLPVSTVLTNTVRISGLKLAQSMFTQTTKVTVVPTLTIAKVQESPLGSAVRVSDTITYRLIYTNTGTALLHNAVLTDTYDSAVEFVSASPPPTTTTANYSRWNLGNLYAGPSGVIVLTVRVKAPQPDGRPVVNLATIDSDETEPVTTQSPPLQIRAPMLSLSKHAPATVVPANSVMTYTLAYTNDGSTYASSVVITDLLPSNVTYQIANPLPSLQSGDLLTWTIPQVVTDSTGSITIRVLVDNNQVNGTVFTNTARIAAAEIVSSFARLTNQISSAPDVTLSKSDVVTSAAAGQMLTYTLSYSNVGNAPAMGVAITDRIPSNVSFQNCLPSCTAMGGGVYSFTIGQVNAAVSSLVTLTVRVSPTLPAGLRAITNTARIRTTTSGDNPSNNFAQDVDAISTVPDLDIRATFVPTQSYPGKVITHTIRYTNVAAIDTTGVIVSATKSPYVTYAPNGWNETGGDVFTWNVGNLGAYQSGMLTFVVSLPLTFTPAMTSFVTTFAIADDGPGGNGIAADVYTATVGVPDLVIAGATVTTDTIRFISPVTVVHAFTATVVIHNRGTAKACNADVPGCINTFNLNVFVNPVITPTSGYTTTLGRGYLPGERFLTLEAGAFATRTIPITVEMPVTLTSPLNQEFFLYFKVDNWNCRDGTPCIPDDADHGLVPESNENNNVSGRVDVPRPRHTVFIPVVLKNH